MSRRGRWQARGGLIWSTGGRPAGMAAIVQDTCRMTSPGTADGQGRGMAISTGMSGLDSSGKGDGPFHNARGF